MATEFIWEASSFAFSFICFPPAGVKRFVYVSAADFGLVNYLLKGYYDGKVTSQYIEMPCMFGK